jgi:KDO2-lipid IV(A) lauroyltransferase
MTVLFRLLALFPLVVLHGLGWVMGWLAFLAVPEYRRCFLENARLAGLPRRQWLRAVGEAGKLVAELPRLWMGRPPAVYWDGDGVVDAALTVGKGIVFLTPHLGCFEITAQAYAARYGVAGHPMTVLFRPARKKYLQSLVAAARSRPGLDSAATTLSGVRQLMRVLKNGHSVGLLPDQVPPSPLGVWAPFFGKPAYTMTLSARLALQSGAPVLIAWGERLSWGRGYVVHVRPMPEDLSTDMAQAAAQINAAMESLILAQPEQYLWGYARYKAPRDSL